MLLRFGLANHGSVREYQELSLIASEAIKDSAEGLLRPDGVRHRVLPAVLIYGANASGKTMIYSGLDRMRWLVLNSFKAGGPDSKILRTPFALDEASQSLPTRFDCDFLLSGQRYHYGFSFDDEMIKEEWLYTFSDNNRRTLFYRTDGNSAITFGKTLRGQNRRITDFMRKNSLFISVAAQNAHEQLSEIYTYFENGFRIKGHYSSSSDAGQGISGVIDSRIMQFLGRADTGIVDARVQREPPTPESKKMYGRVREMLLESFPADIPATMMAEMPDQIKLSFAHHGLSGRTVFFEPSKESQGTIRAFSILKDTCVMLDAGGLLVIDELDSSLHTLLGMEIIKIYESPRLNTTGAQLVATTHDTNLLCSRIVRRDQIWFTEKNRFGETSLYPLTAIRTRNKDNLEKGYLQGRFGAIPFFGSTEELFKARP